MTAATNLFGAYVIQPLSSGLLVGTGNGVGSEDGACVLTGASGAALIREFVLSEQGVHDTHRQGDEIWVCGTDPVEPLNEWALGNLYHRDSGGSWTKLRTLPLTIHAFGCWHDGSALWIASGCHTGDNATFRGRVLKSVNGGQTWSAADVCNYRVYDIIGYGGKLYAIGADFLETYHLYSSSDGVIWFQVGNVFTSSNPRLVIHSGAMYGVLDGGIGLFKVDAQGTLTEVSTPFLISQQWNVLDSDGTHFYVLEKGEVVWRTVNFETWEPYTQVSGAISIKWWAGHGLMIGDLGTSARIWRA